MRINPIDLFLWTFRRNENDVINLYDSLSDVMRLATDGDMLNFGYWTKDTHQPLDAQINMCAVFSELAELYSGQHVVDVGSGFSAPAFFWKQQIPDIKISCVNTSFGQLSYSSNKITSESHESINFVNSTATKLPFDDSCFDRVLALESSQHFKPLDSFILESHRILKKDGMLVLALPVITNKSSLQLTKLGIVAFTWSSEHYAVSDIIKRLEKNFEIIEFKKIGQHVYSPLANFYFNNRTTIKEKIFKKYPYYVEAILAKSIKKMNLLSENNMIDYVLLSCKPLKN